MQQRSHVTGKLIPNIFLSVSKSGQKDIIISDLYQVGKFTNAKSAKHRKNAYIIDHLITSCDTK